MNAESLKRLKDFCEEYPESAVLETGFTFDTSDLRALIEAYEAVREAVAPIKTLGDPINLDYAVDSIAARESQLKIDGDDPKGMKKHNMLRLHEEIMHHAATLMHATRILIVVRNKLRSLSTTGDTGDDG